MVNNENCVYLLGTELLQFRSCALTVGDIIRGAS